VLTTPSATRVYRTEAAGVTQSVRLAIGPRAVVEWVPDHTIPFPGSALRQAIDVELGEGAGLILVDAFSAGRIALGEAWQFTLLDSTVSVRDPGGWLLHDRFVLRGGGTGDDSIWDGLGLAESHPYFASIAVIGALDCEQFAAAVQRRCASGGAARIAVAALARRGALIRCLAPSAPELVDALERCWSLARSSLLGLPPLALRKA
jgi:urease accessory protein